MSGPRAELSGRKPEKAGMACSGQHQPYVGQAQIYKTSAFTFRPGRKVLKMLRIVDFSVKFLYSVLLSAGALTALVVAPPVGIVLLLLLRHYLRRVASSQARPQLHIRLS
jgi:hypothetical protein